MSGPWKKWKPDFLLHSPPADPQPPHSTGANSIPLGQEGPPMPPVQNKKNKKQKKGGNAKAEKKAAVASNQKIANMHDQSMALRTELFVVKTQLANKNADFDKLAFEHNRLLSTSGTQQDIFRLQRELEAANDRAREREARHVSFVAMHQKMKNAYMAQTEELMSLRQQSAAMIAELNQLKGQVGFGQQPQQHYGMAHNQAPRFMPPHAYPQPPPPFGPQWY